MTTNHNMTPNAPETPTRPRNEFSPTRAALVIVLTVALAASSIIMVGPQIVLIVPVALLAGIVFALRRSSWSFVCFGYPFSFGLISAWRGYMALPNYERTIAFAVSICIGLVGYVLVAVGLWEALPSRDKAETGVSNEFGTEAGCWIRSSSMMTIFLTTLGGIVIGSVVGFFGSGPVFHAMYYKGCMTGLTVLNRSLTIGAPIGAVTFGVIGFSLGYLLDRKAKQRQLDGQRDSTEEVLR